MKRLGSIILIFAALGCGVKGDPVAPKSAPEIGRGKPTFKRAMEKIQLPPTDEKNDPDDEAEAADEK